MVTKLLAKFLARPAVADWLIRRAQRAPYTHIVTDGVLYMERYWLFNPYPAESSGSKNWFPISVRIHHIVQPDQDLEMHDHPWHARTFILKGSYGEYRLVEQDGVQCQGYFARTAGDTATLKFGEYHRIDYVPPGGVWTLFVTGKYQGTWGFLVNGEKIQWRKYLGL